MGHSEEILVQGYVLLHLHSNRIANTSKNQLQASAFSVTIQPYCLNQIQQQNKGNSVMRDSITSRLKFQTILYGNTRRRFCASV